MEDTDIEEMFAYADKNCDGKLSYSEFEVTQSDFASPLLPTPKPSLPSSCRGSLTSLSTQVLVISVRL